MFIPALVAVATGLLAGGCGGSPAPGGPNILLVVSDDQRWDELGVVQQQQGMLARFGFLQTPHLDRLAAQGARFSNAFVTTSLCSPSRAAILTGQYNHANRIIDNETAFPDRPTWASLARDAGYATAYFGKWHHGRQWERPGFDYTATYAGQGFYDGTDFRVNGKYMAGKDRYVDAMTTDLAIDYLRSRGDRPFAIMLGFKAPHRPYTAAAEQAELYTDRQVRPSVNRRSRAPWLDATLQVRTDRAWMRTQRGELLERMRTLTSMDSNLGRLLDALDELGLADNTVVIFTSDNGYLLDDHSQGDKRLAYEESIRVPLLVRLPGQASPAVISELALNIDIAPTLLDIAGLPVPDWMQGRSLLPLLQNRATDWRDDFLYEYWQENEFWQAAHIMRRPTVYAVRTRTHKLITYPDFPRWTEMFDLSRDPFETRNLANYPSARATREALCDRLKALQRETGFIDRSGVNGWLLGITESTGPYYRYLRSPVEDWHPPLYRPPC